VERLNDSAERFNDSAERLNHSAERVNDSAERVNYSAERLNHSAERVNHSVERFNHSAERINFPAESFNPSGDQPTRSPFSLYVYTSAPDLAAQPAGADVLDEDLARTVGRSLRLPPGGSPDSPPQLRVCAL
jgi:hypothetical protein